VSGRLSRAHAILRDRLGRRGFAAVVLAPCVAPARVVSAVPPSPVASSLAEGVLFAMRATKLKLAAVLAVGLAGVAGLGTVFALGTTAAPHVAVVQPPPDDPPEKEPDPKTTPDPKWENDRTATAYPDITPLTAAALTEFQTKHLEPVFVADPPLRKLQKVKLRRILHLLGSEVAGLERFTRSDDRKVQEQQRQWWRYETDERVRGLVRDATTVANELELKAGPRPWLVLRVAAEKRVNAAHDALFMDTLYGDVPRFDAEIALAKHDAKK
jgi:hypothetical protein